MSESVRDVLDALSGPGAEAEFGAVDVLAAILVSFALCCLIGWTYQRTHRGALSTQGYVQTLVLMGTVTSVVIMVVGGSVARAFAVFGAFAMIRFRNALPETRDVGFIFFAMVVGMAAGAGRHDMALLATGVICALVLGTHALGLFGARRTGQLLRVRFSNDVDHVEALEDVLARHAESFQLLSVESVQAGLLTEASYSVLLKKGVPAHDLLAEVRQRNGNNRVLLLAHVPDPALADR